MQNLTDYERALQRAERDGVRVLSPTSDATGYRVLGSMRGGRLIRIVNANTLNCDCRAIKGMCTHQAVTLLHMRHQGTVRREIEAASAMREAAANSAVMVAACSDTGRRLFR